MNERLTGRKKPTSVPALVGNLFVVHNSIHDVSLRNTNIKTFKQIDISKRLGSH